MTRPAPRFRQVQHGLGNLRDRIRNPAALIQSEHTPFQVLHREGIVQLRWYPPLEETETRHQTPVVIVPPLAVNMSIYDLFPNRSLVRHLLEQGFPVYLLDWGRPGPAENHWQLATYITKLLPDLLARVRAHANTRQLSLHGWSFGGLFAYAYTAWSEDPDIRNLVLVGAPCDYHNNGIVGRQQQRIGRVVRRVGRIRRLRPHAMPPRLFRSPGWLNSAMYKMTSPVASLRPHLDLLRRLQDRDRVAAHATNSAFVDDMVAYPGGVVQDVLQHLWCDNLLATGRLPIAGSDARLDRITASILLIAGQGDPVVTPQSSRTLLDLVSSQDTQALGIPGGHMSILAGTQTATETWPTTTQWLAERS